MKNSIEASSATGGQMTVETLGELLRGRLRPHGVDVVVLGSGVLLSDADLLAARESRRRCRIARTATG